MRSVVQVVWRALKRLVRHGLGLLCTLVAERRIEGRRLMAGYDENGRVGYVW